MPLLSHEYTIVIPLLVLLNGILIWGWVKTLVPSEHQNSWDLWMFIPLKMVLIGIDPYPNMKITWETSGWEYEFVSWDDDIPNIWYINGILNGIIIIWNTTWPGFISTNWAIFPCYSFFQDSNIRDNSRDNVLVIVSY
jgi:hypothetical protein